MSGKILVYEHPGTADFCAGNLARLRPAPQLFGMHTEEGRSVDEPERVHFASATARGIPVRPHCRFVGRRQCGRTAGHIASREKLARLVCRDVP
jgi:hypothetical protein